MTVYSYTTLCTHPDSALLIFIDSINDIIRHAVDIIGAMFIYFKITAVVPVYTVACSKP